MWFFILENLLNDILIEMNDSLIHSKEVFSQFFLCEYYYNIQNDSIEGIDFG
jgi:hypothetical protein